MLKLILKVKAPDKQSIAVALYEMFQQMDHFEDNGYTQTRGPQGQITEYDWDLLTVEEDADLFSVSELCQKCNQETD